VVGYVCAANAVTLVFIGIYKGIVENVLKHAGKHRQKEE
jgi:hypothetical protein